MSAIKVQTLLVDSVQEVRDIPHDQRLGLEVIVRPTAKRYLYNPGSLADDDGETALKPTVTDCDCCGGKGRWIVEPLGSATTTSADDSDDLTDAEVMVHVLLRL